VLSRFATRLLHRFPAFNVSRSRQSPGGAADPPCAAKALEAFAACVLQRFSISKYFLIDA
jgi:hypothetical protein